MEWRHSIGNAIFQATRGTLLNGAEMSEVLSLLAIVAIAVVWGRFGCG